MSHSIPPKRRGLRRRIDTLADDNLRLHAEVRQLRIQSAALSAANARSAELLSALELARDNAARAEERERAAMLDRRRLIASLGHELRTPLNGVMGALQLLGATPLQPEQRRLAELAQGCSDRLLEAVQHALDFAELETGRILVETTATTPRSLVRHVTQQLGDRVRSGVSLHVRWEDGVPDRLELDESHLRQLLKHVLANALEHTHHGRVLLRIGYEETPARGRLRFEVSDTRGSNDNAVRIPRAVSGKLVRSPDAPDPNQRKEVFGPSVARKLVEAMGGEMEAPGERALGSVLRFWVPTKLASAPVLRQLQDSDAGPPGRALVVDDVETNLLVAEKLLESLGWEVTSAVDGTHALERQREGSFDLVLMDCQMPQLDGFDTTRRWRAQEAAGSHTLIVALTANAQPVDRAHCIASGMDDFLAKPLRREALVAMLAKWRSALDSSRAG